MGQTECGIVGLPNVGKSGLFNALTGAQVASCNYPFCTIDPNVGIVPVIDPRLETLARISQSQKDYLCRYEVCRHRRISKRSS